MNKMKILVAYDSSSFSDAALDDLLRAGLPSEVDALLLHGYRCPVRIVRGDVRRSQPPVKSAHPSRQPPWSRWRVGIGRMTRSSG